MNTFSKALCAVALVLCACSGPGVRSEPRLPFHVAVLPFSAHQLSANADAPDGMQVSLDARRMEQLLIAELNRSCATRATLLEIPGDPVAFGSASAKERETQWVRSAVGIHADMVLDCELEFSPEVAQARNEKFWLNLPLFLLGGPACYFVDDRTYRAHAVLRGRVFDVNPIVAGRADLEDGLSKLADLTSRFERTSLDFIDRAGGSSAAYASSLLLPPGLLWRDSPEARQKLAEIAEHDLVLDFADALMEQSSGLLLAESVSDFHLDPALRVERMGSTIRVHGDVILRQGEVERLDSWRLCAGRGESRGEFAEHPSLVSGSNFRHALVRFPLEARISAAEDVREVRLEITEGGPNPRVRSFTLGVRSEP